VKSSGPDLTRLAWTGWHAEVDLAVLLAVPGVWRVSVELDEQGVQRSRPLGRSRGPLAERVLVDGVMRQMSGRTVRLGTGDGALVLTVARLRPIARVLPAPVRRVLRRLRGR
jgi:hypothetical protein